MSLQVRVCHAECPVAWIPGIQRCVPTQSASLWHVKKQQCFWSPAHRKSSITSALVTFLLIFVGVRLYWNVFPKCGSSQLSFNSQCVIKPLWWCWPELNQYGSGCALTRRDPVPQFISHVGYHVTNPCSNNNPVFSRFSSFVVWVFPYLYKACWKYTVLKNKTCDYCTTVAPQ